MIPVRIGVIGDYDPGYPLHVATTQAISCALAAYRVEGEVEWLATDEDHDYSRFHGLWCSPGSPYRSLDGALKGVRWARVSGTPFIGTCGGFQHAVLEFARNVLQIRDAMHAEYDPYASVLFVRPLTCSLAGGTFRVRLRLGSLAASLYGSYDVAEAYYCNFGLNPDYHGQIEAGGMVISGIDADGEVRIIELADHPFFLATLFVPQVRSTTDSPHPLIKAFCESAVRFSRQGDNRAAE